MDFATFIFAAAVIVQLATGQDDQPDQPTQFEVQLSPQGEEQLVELGKDYLFTCKVSNVPDGQTPTFKWFLEDTEITSSNVDDRVRYQDSWATGRKHKLYIKQLTEADRGIYKCEVTIGADTASAVLNAIVFQPITIESSGTDQFGYVNQEGAVECKAKGSPAPVRTWRFENNTGIITTEKYVIEKDKLIIKDLQFEDAAIYVCDLEVEQTGGFETLRIDYKIVEMPVLTTSPTIQPNNAKVGDEVTITCKASAGTPEPTYQFKRGEVILGGNDDEQVDSQNGILTLKSVTKQSEGTYTCIAQNTGGLVEIEFVLDIRIPPEITSIPISVEAVEKEAKNVECEATGDPAPTITWQKVGQAADIGTTETDGGPRVENIPSSEVDSAEIKTVKSILRFSAVRPQDAGQYKCKARNVVDETEQTLDFEVQYAPHFDTDFKDTEFYGWSGAIANITCMASAHPLATFEWFKGDPNDPDNLTPITSADKAYVIPATQEFKQYSLSSSSLMVTISPTSQDIYGSYVCRASNAQTRDSEPREHTVTLKEAKPPGRPGLKIAESRPTKLVLTAEKPGEDGGQPITSYTVSYYPSGDEPSKKSQTINEVNQEIVRFEIDGLQPTTTYAVTLQAVNVVNAGTAAQIQATTTDIEPPALLRMTSSVEGLEPTKYTVAWEDPDDGGATITKFTFKIRKVNIGDTADLPSASWSVTNYLEDEERVLELTDQPNAKQYTIDGLEANSYYELRFSATNDKGEGQENQELIRTSKGAGSLTDSAGLIMCNVATLLLLLATSCLATYSWC